MAAGGQILSKIVGIFVLGLINEYVKYDWGINWGLDGGGGGSRIRYSIKKWVLIRDSISEISP